MDLEFQIVMQFSIPRSIGHPDDVLAIETALSDALGSSAEVDGHETSATHANVYVLAGDPRATFDLVRKRLSDEFPKLTYVAASRKACDNEDWTLLWPERDGPATFAL